MAVASLPHWDLANVYPGLESDELLRDTEQIRVQLDELDEYLATQLLPAEALDDAGPSSLVGRIAGYLDRMNALLVSYGTMRAYLHAFVATDSYNMTARRLMSETEPLGVRLQRQEVVFRGWLGRVAQEEATLMQVLAQEGAVRDHGFYLKETVEQSRYLMSEAEETLASELALSGSRAWQKLQGVVASQLKVAFESDHRTGQLPITVIQNLRTDPDQAVRRRAYETELAAWEQVSEP